MRVLLIYANKPRLTFGFLPGPYGLEILRARLSSVSIDCTIVNPFLSLDPKSLIEKAIYRGTFLIGLSLRNVDDALVLWDLRHAQGKMQTESCIDDAKEIIAWCRECAPEVPISVGGAAVLHMPGSLLRYLSDGSRIHVDTEEQFVHRAINIAQHKNPLPRIFTGTNYVQTHVPAIERESIYFNFREEAAVRTYSGCPLACSHCIEHVGSRKILRADIADVAREVEMVVKSYANVKRVFFADSEVNLAGENRTRALIQEIRSREPTRHIPLTGYFNPHPLSFDFLKLLSQNAVAPLLTVDHISDSVLSRNGKNFRKHHIQTLVSYYHELGLELSFCLLLGQPGETLQTVDEVLDFVEQIPNDILGPIYFSPGIRVYPDTPIAQALMNQGLDSRWLVGTIDPIHPFVSPVTYCESWNPFDLFEYVLNRSNKRILPMNSYMCSIERESLNVLQKEFHDYHIGLANRDSNKSMAWRAWCDLRANTPFLSSRRRIDFLWQRGCLALENGLFHRSLDDWTQLQLLLRSQNLAGVGVDKLEHNIAVAKHLLKDAQEVPRLT